MFDIMKPFMNQIFVYRLIKYHDKKRNLHNTTELEQEKQDLLDFANKWDIKFDIDHIPKALKYNNSEIWYIDSKKSKKSPMVFSDFF